MVTYLLITHWHWWGLAGLLIIGEIVAPCRYFLALACAAAIMGILTRLLPNVGGFWQLGLFTILAAIGLLLANLHRRRQFVHPKNDTKTET